MFIATAVLTSVAPDVSLGERGHVELGPLHRAALSAGTGSTTGS